MAKRANINLLIKTLGGKSWRRLSLDVERRRRDKRTMNRELLLRFLEEWDRISEMSPYIEHDLCMPCVHDFGCESLYHLLRAVAGVDKTICPGCGRELAKEDWECKGCGWENPDGYIPSVEEILSLKEFKAKDVDLPAFLRAAIGHSPEYLVREEDLYAQWWAERENC